MISPFVVASFNGSTAESDILTTNDNSETFETVNTLSNDDIIIINKSTLEAMNTDAYQNLETKIMGGFPVIVEGVLDYDKMSSLNASVFDSTITAVYHDPESNSTCYFTANGENAFERAKEWATTIKDSVTKQIIESGGDTEFMWFETSEDWGDFSFEARMELNKLGTSGVDTYYAIHNIITSRVDDTHNYGEIAGIVLKADIDSQNAAQELVRSEPQSYKPPEASGSKEFNIGFSYKDFGIEIGTSSEWSFSTSDLKQIKNDSSISSDDLYINFDYDEVNKDVPTAVTVEPGQVVSVNSSTDLIIHFEYELWYVDDYRNLWPWDPDTNSYTFNVPLNITMDLD